MNKVNHQFDINFYQDLLFKLLKEFEGSGINPKEISLNVDLYKLLCWRQDDNFDLTNNYWFNLPFNVNIKQIPPIVILFDIKTQFVLIKRGIEIHLDTYSSFNIVKKKPIKRRKPDRSKVNDLVIPKLEKEEPKKRIYASKVKDNAFDEFNHKDWIYYYTSKAKSNNIKYISNITKDKIIIKSLMKKFQPIEIKLMIDFIFDSGQDIIEKEKCGIWIFSKGWLNKIYNSSMIWKDGEENRIVRESNFGDDDESKAYI